VSVGLRLQAVRARIASACDRAGRAPSDVTLVGVSKKQPPERLRAALEAGLRDFGESYVQELDARVTEFSEADVRWHFIGRLQRNKVKQLLGKAVLVHDVDSERLAREIDKRAAAADRVQRVLVAVNVAGEASKSGVEPDLVADLLGTIDSLAHVDAVGLMTMPPLVTRPEDNRVHFAALRALRDRLSTAHRPLPELSMGTTADFEVAVEEGATLVRVGTAVFGERAY